MILRQNASRMEFVRFTKLAVLCTPIDDGRMFGPLRFGAVERKLKISPKIETTDARVGSRTLPSYSFSEKIQDNPMITGTVKFYNDQKGFGFIAPDSGETDVFVHATALERAGMHTLSQGQKVSFDTARDSRSGKIAVSNIQPA